MKKIFVVTPFYTDNFTTETINNYVAQVTSIARGYLQDEEIEAHTNFFLEPEGVDENGDPIMKLRNHDNMLQYTIEELEEIVKCDAIFKLDWYGWDILTPFDMHLDGHFVGNCIPVYSLTGLTLVPDYIPEPDNTLNTPIAGPQIAPFFKGMSEGIKEAVQNG